MQETITSLSNPAIKLTRSLRLKKSRDESGLFLVEGILHVGEAFEAGWTIETALYCEQRLKSDFGRELVQRLIKHNVHCLSVSEAVFESFSEKDNLQAIAAIVRKKKIDTEVLPDFDLALGLVSPQDPGNVGTILRSMDAAGGKVLFLIDGGVDPYHPSAVRASMGTIFWIPFISLGFVDFLAAIRQHRLRLIGTSAHASMDYRELKTGENGTVILLGSEQKGLTAEQQASCDELISLPMQGRASSLNLAVAAGIFLYSFRK